MTMMIVGFQRAQGVGGVDTRYYVLTVQSTLPI
jgi:hypothetical protein